MDRKAQPGSTRHVTGSLIALAASVATALAIPPGGGAQERLSRTFGPEHGLAAAPVWAIAQDSVGFLWVGAEGGLFRFDGVEFERWAPEVLEAAVSSVAVSPSGRVVALDVRGRVFRVVPSGVELVPWPGTPPRGDGWSLAFDGTGTLWRAGGGAAWFLKPDGEWQSLPPERIDDESVRAVHEAPAGAVHLLTSDGVWLVGTDGELRHLYAAPGVPSAASSSSGGLLALVSEAGVPGWWVSEITPEGGERVRLSRDQIPGGRPIDILERVGTVWISVDRFLVAVGADGDVEVLGQDDGVDSGGPLFIDREGSLWLGTFGGLIQYPEPETRIWAERQGLSSRHVRYVIRSDGVLWTMTWAGASALRREEGEGWRVDTPEWHSQSPMCGDGQGSVWTASTIPETLVEIRGTASVPLAAGALGGVDSLPSGSLWWCAPGHDEGVWMGSGDELLYLDPGRRELVAVPFPSHGERVMPGLHDSRGRVWVTAGDRICRAPAARVLERDGEAWSCDEVGLVEGVVSMAETAAGTIWAASHRVGVLAYAGGGWSPLPMDGLPSRTVFRLVPSPRGGIWVVGSGILQRVVEGSEGPTGPWQVVERLERWHGLPDLGAGDLLEEDDGTLWLATSRGLMRVPAEVRFAPPPVPAVALVDAGVDGAAVPTDGTLVLSHDRNRLEARFAALSFRDPSRVRHQVRLGPDEPWTESRGQPTFRWVDLGPGHYRAQYRASLDGEHWSPAPAALQFQVRPPWYLTGWFLGLVSILAALLGWLAYRARVAYLLGLERQRTRIAMDLHDEVGSGLASVGILSGVLAADGLGEGERRATAQEIATAAEELGHSLSDIVWSLDPRTATVEELATRLAEHGERLCAGDDVGFSASFPEQWPPDVLDVAVRRNALRIGLEALHNAARHGEASRVNLTVQPLGAGVWRLQVKDDGKGAASSSARPTSASGHGLRWMRRRADEIGARFELESRPGQGTVVTLEFQLQGRGRGRVRVGRWRARHR